MGALQAVAEVLRGLWVRVGARTVLQTPCGAPKSGCAARLYRHHVGLTSVGEVLRGLKVGAAYTMWAINMGGRGTTWPNSGPRYYVA